MEVCIRVQRRDAYPRGVSFRGDEPRTRLSRGKHALAMVVVGKDPCQVSHALRCEKLPRDRCFPGRKLSFICERPVSLPQLTNILSPEEPNKDFHWRGEGVRQGLAHACPRNPRSQPQPSELETIMMTGKHEFCQLNFREYKYSPEFPGSSFPPPLTSISPPPSSLLSPLSSLLHGLGISLYD